MRIGADKSPPGFSQFMGVGLDANSDGALDLFLAVENSGNPNRIAIYDAGSGANTSPSSTTINSSFLFSYSQSAANYDFQTVTATSDPTATSFDIDGDNDTDYFLTWVIPFADVVSALAGQSITGITQNSPLRYVVGSSTQPNALNQDLGGPNGGTTRRSPGARSARSRTRTAPLEPRSPSPTPPRCSRSVCSCWRHAPGSSAEGLRPPRHPGAVSRPGRSGRV